MELDYFKENPPTTGDEFLLWWNTMQMELHDKDVLQVEYKWECPVAGTCVTRVPDWMLDDDNLLGYLRESTRAMVEWEDDETDTLLPVEEPDHSTEGWDDYEGCRD